MTKDYKKKIRHKKFRNRPAQITANIVLRVLLYDRIFTLPCVDFDKTHSRLAASPAVVLYARLNQNQRHNIGFRTEVDCPQLSVAFTENLCQWYSLTQCVLRGISSNEHFPSRKKNVEHYDSTVFALLTHLFPCANFPKSDSIGRHSIPNFA
jgi:hypothetical protein